MFAASLTVLAAFAKTGHSAGWNYEERGNNVSHWADLVAECGYNRQSPIDIPMASIVKSCDTPLTLAWTSESTNYVIRNNGHSLVAIPFDIQHNGGGDIGGLEINHHTHDTNIRLTNKFYNTYESPVHREYCFDSLHFHWGRTNDEGSEHTIGGQSWPLELHLVHYACDYYVAGDALKEYASGLADVKYDDENVLGVVGIMFEIGEANPVLDRILDDAIIGAVTENRASELTNYLELYYTEFDVADLLPSSNREIVSYLGSLTTPPCYETVRWHVMKQPMTVSEEQMAKFRSLLEGTDPAFPQAPNFRPPQPRNGREIYACQEDVSQIAVYNNKAAPVEATEATATQQPNSQQTTAGTNNAGNGLAADGSDSEESEWKPVALTFIILFCLSIMASICMLVCLMKKQQLNHHSVPTHHAEEEKELENDNHLAPTFELAKSKSAGDEVVSNI